MNVAERPGSQAVEPQPHNDWPELFVVRAWLLFEKDHWVAVAPEYDIVTQGPNEVMALRSLEMLFAGYLNACAAEGAAFRDIRRPLPPSERLRLLARWLRSRLSHWTRGRRPTRRGIFMPFGGEAHC